MMKTPKAGVFRSMKGFPFKKIFISLQVFALLVGGAGFLGFALPSAHAADGFINITGGDLSSNQFDGTTGAGPFTAYVTWGTSNRAADDVVAVYVSTVDQPDQSLFATDPSGTSRSSSLYPNSNPTSQNIYTFNLYSRKNYDDPNDKTKLNLLASATATVTPRGNPTPTPTPTPAPTATLTANGSHSVTVSVGQQVLYTWSSPTPEATTGRTSIPQADKRIPSIPTASPPPVLPDTR